MKDRTSSRTFELTHWRSGLTLRCSIAGVGMKAMATRTLIEKIEALPPEKKAEVEEFVESLGRSGGTSAGSEAHPKEVS
jgi:hypothetical protein